VTRGLVTLHEEPLEIASVVADAFEQVRGLFQARHQHLALHLPTRAAVVNGDRTRLVQVFANVLNNAAKYTSDGGHVEVRVDVEGDQVEFSVRDDGVGIAPDLLPHVFELFTQAERSPDRSQGGLGLGLALVKSLVELHGGRVAAYSNGPGSGSRFTVRLPCTTEDARPAAGSDAEVATPARSAALSMLVVDDNMDAAQALCLLLEALGHSVCVAHDARSAIAHVRREATQILFLDIGLPDMDGFELARRLRAMPEAADAVLVAVTGYGRAGDKERARQAGFDRHMTKPVKLAALLELISDRAGQHLTV
jgi:CheY-like chemotaxis protein